VFSDDMMRYIGYIEICVGLGLGMGPVLGSVVYSEVGYEYTMYFFGVCDFFTLIICFFLIPDVLNATISDEDAA